MDVVCALIWKDTKILAVKRNNRSYRKGKWEFPGGKVESYENPEQAIKREILEELNLNINPVKKLPSINHHYPEHTIRLIPFICYIEGGRLSLKEHTDYQWVEKKDLIIQDWSDADKQLLMIIHNNLPDK